MLMPSASFWSSPCINSKAEGAAFKPRYLELLSSGGSRSPDDILKKAGINMRDAAFWQGGFDVVSGMVDELEKLSGK